VRAGSILPLGPVKQHVYEQSDEPLTISIFPGADASFLLYEDDGKSFNYRNGEWMGLQMSWADSQRVLTLQLADGSRMRAPLRRNLAITINQTKRQLEFDGKRIEIRL
jgi:alpha-D-xyloside xylohydrolase